MFGFSFHARGASLFSLAVIEVALVLFQYTSQKLKSFQFECKRPDMSLQTREVAIKLAHAPYVGFGEKLLC